MTTNFTKQVTAAVFAVLFSGTMLLSAVGPAIGTSAVAATIHRA